MRGIATIFKNNTFSSNSVQTKGGAVLLEDPGVVHFEENLFFNNSADLPTQTKQEKTGGAIFYSCDPDIIEDCNVGLTNNNFTNNFAINKGGALRWVNKNFTSTYDTQYDKLGRILQESEDSNTFSGNDAHYGADQGSYPASL